MVEKIKKIPWWGYVLGVFYFVLQYGLYRLAHFLSVQTGTINRSFAPKIPFLDDAFPVVGIFVIIYIFSYVFWICGPIAVSLTRKENLINYIVGLSMAYLIGFLIFWFLPTHMDRVAEGLMDISSGNDFSSKLLGIVYSADGSEIAFNLFPSYHCLISLYCYLGVRGQEEISKGFRAYSLIMTILICLSTLLTKQHYIADMIGGLGISICCYLIVKKWNPGKKFI